MIEIIHAIILGIIEGFTEFLPISSTGHLIVAQDVLAYKDATKTFTVVIQLGAIAAVIYNYRKDLISKLKINNASKSFWLNIFVATLPAGLLGLILAESFSQYAVARVVAVSLIVGGVVIWLIETFHQPKKTVNSVKIESISVTSASLPPRTFRA